MRLPKTLTVSAMAGAVMVGALAGCSTTPDADTDAGSDEATQPSGTGSYADGTYTEDGSYQSPAGQSEVSVTVTIADNLVTAVEVDGDATDPTAKRYQGEFIDGIESVVVGKRIDSLNVSKVGGSSLTSGGFNSAIDKILAEAGA
jgi:uncharacterized protein with FMN-binding domain